MSVWDGWHADDEGAVAIAVVCDGPPSKPQHPDVDLDQPILIYVEHVDGRPVLGSIEHGDARDAETDMPLSAAEIADLHRAQLQHPDLPVENDLLPRLRGRRTYTCPTCGNSLTLRDATLVPWLRSMVERGLTDAGVSWVRLRDLQLYDRSNGR